MQGIVEVKTWQQQFGKAGANGYNDIRTNVQDMKAIINEKSHQATIRSEALMREVPEDIAEATSTSSAQHETIRRMNREVKSKLLSTSVTLEVLPSIASEHLSALQSLIEMLSNVQLRTRTERQSLQPSTTTEIFLPRHDRRNDLEMSLISEMKKVLARLPHLGGKMTASGYSIEAQSVIEDIGGLLGMVMQQMSATSPSPSDLLRKRKQLCDFHYSELEAAVQSMEALRKAKRVLTACQRIQICNQGL